MIGASKLWSVSLLVLAQIAGMSLWFTSAAVLPDMVLEGAIAPFRQAMLSTGVQAGFVVGALVVAISGVADRLDPRRVLAASALLAALANALLLVVPLGGDMAIAARFVTGACLAGVYPVGMKIAVGWGTADRGFLIGLLVGALTLGSASPHLLAFLGGTDWQLTVSISSLFAAVGGLAILTVGLGPHHARSPSFRPGVIALAWTDATIRRAYLGYFGHMWELYAMWAWIGVAVTVSYGVTLGGPEAIALGKLTAFLAVALGGVACIAAGLFADRIGKAEVTIVAMAVSAAAAILTALTFGGPVWLTLVIVVIWGIAVIPDSAQFSAIVADAAPPDISGSLLTLQTAIGFTLTIFTVQLTPVAAGAFGWPIVLAALAIGPVLGILAMLPLRRGRRAMRRGASAGEHAEAGMQALHLQITGRIQGVGYRAWFHDEAVRLGLTGWVRNRRDGTVEAVIAGPPDRVQVMLQASRTGPPAAQVAEAAIVDEPAAAGHDFKIRPTL